ncbi:MAG: HDOD domain-containing protein [Humidesulfovibrio sp.]|nr:HD family phosphohydrolase [Desulfovibrio sp.]MDO9083876.1 HDOD domain-containing protein [Humidesulfovibrio sp.]
MEEDLKTSAKGKILSIRDLPTLPKVLEEVSRLVQNPNTTIEAIAKVISRDQVLSAKVLKMVNSPVYGFSGRISSIQHSLVLLGFNVIRGVIISTSVFDIMTKAMEGLWEHSVGCALATGLIARKAGLKDPEEFSVCGLLHDLGKVVAAVQLPDLHKAVGETVRTQDLRWLEAEKAVLGFGHDRINAWLAEHWRLPATIKEAMGSHHFPERAQIYPQHAAAVHLGDFVVRVFEYGCGGDDQAVPLSPQVWKILNLKLSDLDSVLDGFAENLAEVSGVTFAPEEAAPPKG